MHMTLMAFVLGFVTILAQKLGKDKETLVTSRPVVSCAYQPPDRIYYGSEQSFNFTQVYTSEDEKHARDYSLALRWAKDRVVGESSVSMQGKRWTEDINWRCLKKCLAMNRCASFVVTESRKTDDEMGLTQCYFFAEPIKKVTLEEQRTEEETRAIRAYSIVCPKNIQDFYDGLKNPKVFTESEVRRPEISNDNDEAQLREMEDIRNGRLEPEKDKAKDKNTGAKLKKDDKKHTT